MIFVGHVTLQDDMIKAFYDFMVRNTSSYVTILPSLVPISIVVEEMY